LADVEFKDFSMKVKKRMDQAAENFLEEACALVESQAKMNSRVRTGQTKGSIDHRISDNVGYVGSNYQNAIWEEFGTGEYALKGDGRKGGWLYKDESGETHFTRGKKPSRALWNSYNTHKKAIKDRANRIFGGIS